MLNEGNKDIWNEIDNKVSNILKDYKYIKKEITIIKSINFNLIKDWESEFFKTNLGQVIIYFKKTYKGSIVINVLEDKIQNISFGSDNKDDLIGLIGSFFVKNILDWY